MATTDPSFSAQPPGKNPESAHAIGIQPTPPALESTASASTPAKPARKRRQPMSAEALRTWIRVLDGAIVLVVLALAFLSASFAVRNSDFWMHLATGRLIANGQYEFGKDPFSFTTEGIYWANHAWLYDLAIFNIYQLADGIGVVVFKALLISLLAMVLMSIRKPGQSIWIPACCTALALVVMSPRFLLQPAIVSFLFLGVTLWLTYRPILRAEGEGSYRSLWLLPLLFILWVNLDNWFFVGLLALVLTWTGLGLQRLIRSDKTELSAAMLKNLGLVTLACFVCCLISPHHIHVFAIPPEIETALPGSVFQDVPLIRTLGISPFHPQYFGPDGLGRSPAGFTYVPLVLLGVLSFALTRRQLSWDRLVLWLGFFLPTLWIARLIPFFAVVSVPVLALNFLDLAVRRFGAQINPQGRSKEWLLGGRVLTLIAGALLLAVTWPGLLQAYSRIPEMARVVCWKVEPDPSFVEVCQQLHEWHASGKLHDTDHGYPVVIEMPNYYAWFCPEEKGFFDYRLGLFHQVADKQIRLQRALMVDPRKELDTSSAGSDPTGKLSPEIRKTLRDWKVNHLVVGNTGTQESGRLIMRFLANRLWLEPEQWPMLYLNGRSLVFGMNDASPESAQRFGELALNLNAMAFGPHAVRAPRVGPGRAPHGTTWMDRYLEEPKRRPVETDESILLAAYFLALGPRQVEEKLPLATAALYGALIIAPAGNGNVFAIAAMKELNERKVPQIPYFVQMALVGSSETGSPPLLADRGPPALAYLSVRAARRAVVENPDDAATYGQLHDAYALLREATREKYLGEFIHPLFSMIRDQQMVSALQHALVLQPRSVEFHEKLANYFLSKGYLDTGLKHMKESLEAGRTQGFPGREEDERKKIEQSIKQIEALDKEVKARRDQYIKAAEGKSLMERVRLARNYGLMEQAIYLLKDIDQTKVPTDQEPGKFRELLGQFQMKIQILMQLGLIDEAQHYLDPFKGHPEFLVNTALVAAANGDYDEAEQDLKVLEETLAQKAGETSGMLDTYVFGMAPNPPSPLERVIPMAVAKMLLEQPIEARCFADLTFQRSKVFNAQTGFRDVVLHLHDRGQAFALRGMLALEQGDVARAIQYLERAQQLLYTRLYVDSNRRLVIDSSSRGAVDDFLGMIRAKK